MQQNNTIRMSLDHCKLRLGLLLDWELTLDDGSEQTTIRLSPATADSDNALYRFEPCEATGENQFIPKKGANYTVTVKVYDGDLLLYEGEGKNFRCNMNPVVGGKYYTGEDPVDPVDPVDPTDPTVPVDPADPIDPVEPGDDPAETPNDTEPQKPSDDTKGGNAVMIVVIAAIAVIAIVAIVLVVLKKKKK